MNRRVIHLEAALVPFSVSCDDNAVLGLRIVRIHTAKRGEAKTTVCFHFRYHAAERIRMCLHKDTAVSFTAFGKLHQKAALCGDHRRIAHRFVLCFQPCNGILRVAGRAVDGEQFFQFLCYKININLCIFHVSSSSFCFCFLFLSKQKPQIFLFLKKDLAFYHTTEMNGIQPLENAKKETRRIFAPLDFPFAFSAVICFC